MQRMITANGMANFESKVNAALEEGWRVVPGTTYAECGFYELAESYKRDYDKTTASEWFYSVVVERPFVEPPSRPE